MPVQESHRSAVPRIEYLRVQNYRALHDLELKNITPLTVLLGPNGSGKSTVFDVFAFLSPSASRSGCARHGTSAAASRSCGRAARTARLSSS